MIEKNRYGMIKRSERTRKSDRRKNFMISERVFERRKVRNFLIR